jgi:hypothetical protein
MPVVSLHQLKRFPSHLTFSISKDIYLGDKNTMPFSAPLREIVVPIAMKGIEFLCCRLGVRDAGDEGGEKKHF